MYEPTHPTAQIEALLFAPQPFAGIAGIVGVENDFVTTSYHRLTFDVDPNGILGGRHYGNTALADVRAPAYAKKQDTVLNRQSISIVDAAGMDHYTQLLELDPEVCLRQQAEQASLSRQDMLTRIAAQLCLTPKLLEIEPQRITRLFLARQLGANVLLGDFRGTQAIPEFRAMPSGYDFGPYNPLAGKFSGATVMIYAVNDPCIAPGKKIEAAYPADQGAPDKAKRFAADKENHRGFVGPVAKAGEMTVGQRVIFNPPRGRIPRQ